MRIIEIALATALATGCTADPMPHEEETEAELNGWCNEQPVPIVNLPPQLYVEEPFVRIVGTTTLLYFSDHGPGELRDLHHAVWVSGIGFVYGGPLQGVNTAPFIEGAPSVDAQGFIYFTNTALPEMIGRGWLSQPGTVAASSGIPGMPARVQIGTTLHGNMDLGVAPNHPFAILSRAVWIPPGALPIQADLWYLRRAGGVVSHDPLETAYFLGALNTQDRLEYAAELSGDGLAIVYTQLDPAAGTTRIMAAVRARVDLPFGPPAPLVENAPGTAIEGPTIIPDRIFFHKIFLGGGPSRLYTIERCGP
ncbi:MAG TPA: hypothetical protein VNO30_18735 [Kofleriaceae bacterium]|nr:hypothetical protein [Kofleriaceae bacterium]